MDTLTILGILTILFMSLGILDLAMNFWKKYPWFAAGLFFILLIIILGYYYWWKDIPENEESTVVVEEQKVDIQSPQPNETFNISNREVRLVPGTPRIQVEQLTYDQFKLMCMTPAYLKKMEEALRFNYNLKSKQYTKIRKELLIEIGQMDKPGPLPSPKDEAYSSVQGILKEVMAIQVEIKGRLKDLTVEVVENNMKIILYHTEHGLEHLIGRQQIKDLLARQLNAFACNPRVFFSTFQNLVLMAGSGYGKTHIAKVMAHVYRYSGILIRNMFYKTTKADFTTAYVNHSPMKTRAALQRALEGVLLMDEAYEITPESNIFGVDHGSEAITELVNFSDKMQGLSVIIAAGYEEPMKKRFLNANEGMDRRFPHKIVLDGYSSDELTRILLNFLRKSNPDWTIQSRDKNYIYTIINRLASNKEKDYFSKQAGDMSLLAGEISTAYYNIPNCRIKEAVFEGVNSYLRKCNEHIEMDVSMMSDIDG